MDGDQMANAPATALTRDQALHERDESGRVAAPRPKTVRWLVIVGLLLVVVLGGLYGFNRFRTQAIANFFAHNKPPPAQISAVVAENQSVPRFAPGIGSLTAVHQVTINPEVGGRVTKIYFEPGQTVKAGDPLGPAQRRARSRRPRQLPGAGANSRRSTWRAPSSWSNASSRRRRPSTRTRASSTRWTR